MIEYGLNKYNGTSKNVVIPQGTTGIPIDFFSNLAIESVFLPEGIEWISPGAFENCKNLKSINFPSTLKKVGNYAFSGCENLKTDDFKACLLDVGAKAFADCHSLKKMVIDIDSQLHNDAFSGCDFDELIIKNLDHGLKFVDDNLSKYFFPFSGCKGKKLILDNNVDRFVGAIYRYKDSDYPDKITSVFNFSELYLPKTIKEIDQNEDVLHQFDKIVFYGDGKLNSNVLNALINRKGRDYIIESRSDDNHEWRLYTKSSYSGSDPIVPVTIENLSDEEKETVDKGAAAIRLVDDRRKKGLCIKCGGRLTRKSLLNSYKICRKCGYEPGY